MVKQLNYVVSRKLELANLCFIYPMLWAMGWLDNMKLIEIRGRLFQLWVLFMTLAIALCFFI